MVTCINTIMKKNIVFPEDNLDKYAKQLVRKNTKSAAAISPLNPNISNINMTCYSCNYPAVIMMCHSCRKHICVDCKFKPSHDYCNLCVTSNILLMDYVRSLEQTKNTKCPRVFR
jgi:hypothetical protein